ncbi:hypothetical protein FQN50_009056 [Emmonsiellopsis sp. PD_5]|nr:hypothetical protein FQN50_009056 [Emmonsiellopsis sp. PD_5]
MAVVIDLTDLRISPREIRSPFLRLPAEVRNQIYSYLLVSPDKLSRRHGAFCQYARRDSSPEPPPFSPSLSCPCSRRQCFGLLLANRQIYSETIIVFLSDNMHYFDSAATFSNDIGNRISDHSRQYIRHVGIVSTSGSLYPNHLYGLTPKYWRITTMWDNILQCKNLENLELETEHLERFHAQYFNIPTTLPRLRSLTLVHLQMYSRADYGNNIYVKFAERIPLGLGESDFRSAIRSFQRLCCSAYTTREFMDGISLRTVAPPLSDNSYKRTITLPDGNRSTIIFYGVPNSQATRIRHSRQRQLEDARRKACGLRSLQEEELSIRVKKAKEAKEQALERNQQLKESQQRQEKESQRDKSIREQTTAEAKQKANRRVHRQRKIRKAEELKQEERKRVPKNT